MECCIKNCKSLWTPTTGLNFHRFPPVHSATFQIWLNYIPEHLMKKLKKFTSIRICSKHFAESDYRCSSSKRYLKKDAFPTIFEQNSTSIIEHFVSNERSDLMNVSLDSNAEEIVLKIDDTCKQAFTQTKDTCMQASAQTRDTYTQTSTQTRDKSIQKSQERMPFSPTEQVLRKKIKNLYTKLKRKENKIKYYDALMMYFRKKELKTSFIHLSILINVYCILDAAYMIKLIRNTFFDKMLYSKAGKISFEYIRVLHILQEMDNLKLCNKLSKEHTNFYNKKVNVRLAVQVISNSVPDAIDFLRKAGNQDFINSEATTDFIRIFELMY